MFKKLFCLSVCLSLPLLGENHSIPKEENMQIGRYQMVGVACKGGGQQLYLLDTATGCVWRSTAKNSWIQHDAWEPLIVTSSDNALPLNEHD